jgi:hypothetical protein
VNGGPSSGIVRRNYGTGHAYYVDGEKLDGVTTILGTGLPKPALVPWASRVTAAYAVDHWAELDELPVSQRMDQIRRASETERDSAARRGIEVHRLGSLLVAGVEVEVPDELAGHVESYVRFLDEWHPVPVLVEATVVHRRYRYAGTLDLVADLPALGERWLFDIKTARSGIYGETALQLEAYASAEVYVDDDGAEVKMPEVAACAVVHVRSDGYDVYRLPHDAGVFSVFRHVQFVARQIPLMREWVSSPLRAPVPR